MKIVIAPGSFKESLSSLEAASQIQAGFREVFPQWTFIKVAVADGGEGTVAALITATGGQTVTRSVTGPLGDTVQAFFGLTGDGRTAVIEMAAACGLGLVSPRQRDPLRTTTHGVGELILAALDRGARHFIVGLGGSATNDGGAGMAQALGVRLLDEQGRSIGPGGGALAALARIEMQVLDPRLADCEFEVACDVDNPLTGPGGASAIFGPQKGANPTTVRLLDDNLRRYAERIETDLGRAVSDLAGGGAGGGMGAGMVAFLNAQLRPGFEIVASALGLERIVADADLIVTGEGRIDSQSVHGKTPVAIARLAKTFGKPVIAFAGGLGTGAEQVHAHGLDAIFSVVPQPCTLEQALARAPENLRVAARNVATTIRIGLEMNASSHRQGSTRHRS